MAATREDVEAIVGKLREELGMRVVKLEETVMGMGGAMQNYTKAQEEEREKLREKLEEFEGQLARDSADIKLKVDKYVGENEINIKWIREMEAWKEATKQYEDNDKRVKEEQLAGWQRKVEEAYKKMREAATKTFNM